MYGKKRLERSEIAAMAVQVWVCHGCLRFNYGRWDAVKGKIMKPPHCSDCHRMDFEYFQSKGEAEFWMKLLHRAAEGRVKEIERQYRINLVAVHKDTGKPVVVKVFLLDFRWWDVDEERRVWAEYKPVDGMSYDAEIKIEWARAMGYPIEIVSG